jgi:hypothetical protein
VGVTVRSRPRPGAALVPTAIGLAVVAIWAAIWAARIFATPGHWLWNPDMPKIDFPLAVFANEALTSGHLPLWNDRLGLGFPLYAEGQVGAFYPPNWLLFRLAPITALDATRVVHLAFAGLGAGLLVLRIRGSRPGALVAVLVAVLGGAITAKLEWHNLVASYAWLPWVLLPLVRRPGPTRAGVVVAGLDDHRRRRARGGAPGAGTPAGAGDGRTPRDRPGAGALAGLAVGLLALVVAVAWAWRGRRRSSLAVRP